MNPLGGHPLRLAFQRIDLRQQLMIGALCVIVDDDHVEEMTPARFHVPSGGNDVLKLLLLREKIAINRDSITGLLYLSILP